MSSIADRRKARERQRKVKAAVEHFRGELPGNFKGRIWALGKIREAPRPMTEAKRLVEWFRTQDIADTAGEEIGFDAVQELRTRIIRRHGIIDRPHAMLLARMDALIASGEIDRTVYDQLAAAVIAMPMVLPRTYLG